MRQQTDPLFKFLKFYIDYNSCTLIYIDEAPYFFFDILISDGTGVILATHNGAC